MRPGYALDDSRCRRRPMFTRIADSRAASGPGISSLRGSSPNALVAAPKVYTTNIVLVKGKNRARQRRYV